MVLLDLSHPILEGMPVYPGEPGPGFHHAATMETDGYRVKWLNMGSHTGTHVDAPAHLVPEGKMLDQYPVSQFSGEATIVSLPEGMKLIDLPFLKAREQVISSSDFVLLKSGWSKYWGSDRYFTGFPTLTEEAARWLTGFGLKGIGLDTISADSVGSHSLPVHHILLGAGLLIIENLCFPEDFRDTAGWLYVFPLPLRDADGSPVRAVLSVDKKR